MRFAWLSALAPWAVLSVALVVPGGCSSPPSPPAADEGSPAFATDPAGIEAIRAVLAADDVAGTRRNHASESAPLSQALRDYVAELEDLDLSTTPLDFARAFRRHLEAWRGSIDFFAAHDDMRGELHEIFEKIRGLGPRAREGLEAEEARIWGTWDEVEASVRRHGATSDPQE